MNKSFNKLPVHIAFILDGNGRWALKHHHDRNYGHLMGLKNVKNIVKECRNLNIKYISLYCFSVENMKRDANEVNYLMDLARKEFQDVHDKLDSYDYNIRIIGEKTNLKEDIIDIINKINSKNFIEDAFTVFICFNYSSQIEIFNASRNVETIEELERNLYTYPAPMIDLIVRTSGEERLSNFMLYQASYAELYFDKRYWPDFHKKSLYRALREYQKRKRNFGK